LDRNKRSGDRGETIFILIRGRRPIPTGRCELLSAPAVDWESMKGATVDPTWRIDRRRLSVTTWPVASSSPCTVSPNPILVRTRGSIRRSTSRASQLSKVGPVDCGTTGTNPSSGPDSRVPAKGRLPMRGVFILSRRFNGIGDATHVTPRRTDKTAPPNPSTNRAADGDGGGSGIWRSGTRLDCELLQASVSVRRASTPQSR